MIRFISFEGGDGTGKTTQIRLLEQHLARKGKACVLTREPGGTTLGKIIRQAVLGMGDKEVAGATELFLYLADRAQHVQEVILPALSSGRVVLCDRFTDSTLAYQGYGRGVDLDMLRRFNRIASREISPDLTFLMDCPVGVGLARAKKRIPDGMGDRFESEKVDFHERVRRGFLELARSEPERIVVIDASRSIPEVHGEIRRIVDAKLEGGQ